MSFCDLKFVLISSDHPVEIDPVVALCQPASSSHLHAGEILAQVCLRNQSTSFPLPPFFIISSTCWRNPCTVKEYLWKVSTVHPWLVHWVLCACTRDFFPALAALVGLVVQNTNYFCSSPYTVLLHLSPAPSKLGRQSCYVTCVSVTCSMMSLHNYYLQKPPVIRL